MTIDEAIAHARAVADTCEYEASKYDMCDSYESQVAYQEGKCGEEHEQLAEWLEELKALRLLLDWAIECDFGLDSFPEEYAKYKHTLTDDMTHNDMMIQIAKCVVEEEIGEHL